MQSDEHACDEPRVRRLVARNATWLDRRPCSCTRRASYRKAISKETSGRRVRARPGGPVIELPDVIYVAHRARARSDAATLRIVTQVCSQPGTTHAY